MAHFEDFSDGLPIYTPEQLARLRPIWAAEKAREREAREREVANLKEDYQQELESLFEMPEPEDKAQRKEAQEKIMRVLKYGNRYTKTIEQWGFDQDLQVEQELHTLRKLWTNIGIVA